jgi:hypothetical protein
LDLGEGGEVGEFGLLLIVVGFSEIIWETLNWEILVLSKLGYERDLGHCYIQYMILAPFAYVILKLTEIQPS